MAGVGGKQAMLLLLLGLVVAVVAVDSAPGEQGKKRVSCEAGRTCPGRSTCHEDMKCYECEELCDLVGAECGIVGDGGCPPCEKQCTLEQACVDYKCVPACDVSRSVEIVFVVDDSVSMLNWKYQRMRETLFSMLDKLDKLSKTKGSSEVSIVTTMAAFSNFWVNPTGWDKPGDLRKALDSQHSSRWAPCCSTEMDQGLAGAQEAFSRRNSDPAKTHRMVILMTDGGANNMERTLETALAVRNQGILVWVVDFGGSYASRLALQSYVATRRCLYLDAEYAFLQEASKTGGSRNRGYGSAGRSDVIARSLAVSGANRLARVLVPILNGILCMDPEETRLLHPQAVSWVARRQHAKIHPHPGQSMGLPWERAVPAACSIIFAGDDGLSGDLPVLPMPLIKTGGGAPTHRHSGGERSDGHALTCKNPIAAFGCSIDQRQVTEARYLTAHGMWEGFNGLLHMQGNHLYMDTDLVQPKDKLVQELADAERIQVFVSCQSHDYQPHCVEFRLSQPGTADTCPAGVDPHQLEKPTCTFDYTILSDRPETGEFRAVLNVHSAVEIDNWSMSVKWPEYRNHLRDADGATVMEGVLGHLVPERHNAYIPRYGSLKQPITLLGWYKIAPGAAAVLPERVYLNHRPCRAGVLTYPQDAAPQQQPKQQPKQQSVQDKKEEMQQQQQQPERKQQQATSSVQEDDQTAVARVAPTSPPQLVTKNPYEDLAKLERHSLLQQYVPVALVMAGMVVVYLWRNGGAAWAHRNARVQHVHRSIQYRLGRTNTVHVPTSPTANDEVVGQEGMVVNRPSRSDTLNRRRAHRHAAEG